MLKGKFASISAAVLAGICFVGSYAMSDDKAKQPTDPAAGGGMDPAMIERWMKYATPGEHHKNLEPMVGHFKYVNKFRMDPQAPWMESDGECHGEMALGGRYLLSQVQGPMMGENFEGMGCLGYDNNSGKHFMGWIDNMGTGMMKAEGTCSDNCKVITFEGRQDDPMTGKADQPYKIQYVIKDDDNYEMHFWAPAESGEMFENMTITFARVK